MKAKYDDHLQATLFDKNKIYSGAIPCSIAGKDSNYDIYKLFVRKTRDEKTRGPQSKNQKKTLRIWLGGGDGAAWVDHAPPGGRVDGTSRSLTRPQPMAPPATDAASSWLGIAEMSRPLSGSRLDCWRCSVSVSTTLPSRRRRPYLLLIPRT